MEIKTIPISYVVEVEFTGDFDSIAFLEKLEHLEERYSMVERSDVFSGNASCNPSIVWSSPKRPQLSMFLIELKGLAKETEGLILL